MKLVNWKTEGLTMEKVELLKVLSDVVIENQKKCEVRTINDKRIYEIYVDVNELGE